MLFLNPLPYYFRSRKIFSFTTFIKLLQCLFIHPHPKHIIFGVL